jgi:phosphopantothenoylcysteine decarboxylase/phosphopantothenate--cysteine ligase
MNPAMFAHAAVRENVRVLRERGVRILGPAQGDTACGEIGEGRMIEPDEIVESIAEVFAAPRTGRRVLVTLGPTQSSIDPVRYVTNHSSGLMGAALAWQAWRAGHEVVAVCGASEVDLPRATTRVNVQTAEEMKTAVEKYWPESQVFCGAAAVLDWEVASPASVKLKKDEGALEVEWKPSPDILKWVGEHKKPGQFVLGFAAETNDVAAYASRKLAAKNCDAIFANDVSRDGIGFGSLDNAGWWIDASGSTDEIPKTSKVDLAREIMRRIDGPTA